MTHPTDALRLVQELRAAANGMFTLKNERGDYGYFDSLADRIESLSAAPASPLPEGGLPPISLDGPHTPNRNRQWLARQLLDSKLDDDEAYSIVRHHPAVGLPAAPTGEAK